MSDKVNEDDVQKETCSLCKEKTAAFATVRLKSEIGSRYYQPGTYYICIDCVLGKLGLPPNK